ncbi:hypothetical protein DPMN_039015 [Dreissena polymorpha]|uniref:Uncharacterized protein n=1 Tax=Dreissena polymorpha TaxID=45954 RepID=A0A9D4MHG6_DREPO|nr:hypothetical protein DPMN_039015 [Dreissena polymorpha]
MSSHDPVKTQPRNDWANVFANGFAFQGTGTFRKDYTVHITSRVLTRKTATPADSNAFQWTGNILKPSVNTDFHCHTMKTTLPPDSNGFQWTGSIVVPDALHDDLTIHVTSISTTGNAPAPGGHSFQRIETILNSA